jgi:hypothetical protein
MPVWLWALVSGGCSIVAALIGLVRYWMRLQFLRDVFERHGDRRDLDVAGNVTSPGWSAISQRARRRRRQQQGPTLPDVTRNLPFHVDEPPPDTNLATDPWI